jgi:ribonuclease BN (tRNA processing enzyme)
VQITVLGKSPAWQDAAGACSGYLVQEDGFTLLLDCGNGVFSKLRRTIDYVDVNAVLISHMHADHMLDLVPYSYALCYAPRQQPVPVGGHPGTEFPARPWLYVPSGGTELFRKMVSCWGPDDLIDNAFKLREYQASDELTIGPLRVRFCEVPHYTVTHAIELSSNGSRFTFSADCSPNPQLIQFARDTDVLLIEATLPRPERTGIRGHLTPGEAGQHGHDASARRLILTHYSDEMDPDWAREEAVRTYGGPVELAREGEVYSV